MTQNPNTVILVTSGKELITEMEPSLSARNMEYICVPNLKYAEAQISTGNCIALIADFGWLAPTERPSLLSLHKRYSKIPFFILETANSMSPMLSSPIRRLTWPLPLGFADHVRVISRPVIIFTEQVLFNTGDVQKFFHEAGVQYMSIEWTNELPDLIQRQIKSCIPPQTQTKKTQKKWWLFGRDNETEEIQTETHLICNLFVVKFSGTMQDADTVDSSIRTRVPEAICYFVSGADIMKYAIQALKDAQVVSLPREYAGHIAGILAEIVEKGEALFKHRGKEKILLIDNFKPTLDTLKHALSSAGYYVISSMNAEESIRLCQKGAFDLAVIGTAITFAEHTGVELAQKMRERDPDLRIIFMVDQYPLHAALKGVSQVVELGLDDVLLKPVEASRLIFSVEKALEKRFLMLENVRLLKETQELNRQLAAINSFQKKFFATVAHDVKSPLTAILGYSEVLMKKLQTLPDEQRYASNINTSAKTLNILISDLVDIAAIESGKLRVEMGALNLLSVIKEVYERVKIAAQRKNLTMSAEVPQEIPPLVGDNARIGQVVQNLCTNAIQYTKEGGKITIKVETEPDRVVISVIDTGIGISKEDLPRVWERFFQTKEAQDMRKGGFGLGLKIAREIVQRHGGEMGIESELGVGSRFFFYLPIKKQDSITPEEIQSQPSGGIK